MSINDRGTISVVLDINVYLDYIRKGNGSLLLPSPEEIPSGESAADALALAFEERFRLFASPHIFRNINRVMHQDGHSETHRRKFIEFVADVCASSGGAVVEPIVLDHAIGDYEDNNILALAKDPAVDADVIASSDHHLLDIGPAWSGRLIMRPRDLASRVMQSTRAALPAAQAAPPAGPGGPALSRRFPELDGVRVATSAAGRYPELSVNDDDDETSRDDSGLGLG